MNEPAPSPGAALDPGRLRWRCRRGMKELDVLLERYRERDLGSASSAECEAFVGLLELQDPELARYLLVGEVHPDPVVAAVVSRMRSA